MPLDKEAVKARLLAQYASHLDAMLDHIKAEQDLDLTEIEDMALQLRQTVGHAATQVLARSESEKQAVDVACPDCQQTMRYKGRKGKWMKTRTGEVRVERPYYYCGSCQRGHFPPR